MSPALRMKVAAVELAAAIEKAFPSLDAPVWKHSLLEQIADQFKHARNSTWKEFAVREPSALYTDLLWRVPDLKTIRHKLRKCWKLTHDKDVMAVAGAAGEEYRALLRDLLATPRLRWTEEHDERRFLVENEIYCPCDIGVNPLNPRLAERMANAVQPLVVASQPVNRGRRGKDPKTDAAVNLFESLRNSSHSVADAEQIVKERLGVRYAPGSLSDMLRARKRRERKAA